MTKKAKKVAPKKKAKKPGILAHLGGLVGGYLGGVPGAKLGQSAGAYFSKVTGMGAYRIRKNTLMTNNSDPAFGNMGSGVLINHREFLQDVTGSTTFTLTSYPINPGQIACFPWLAQVAANFEQYEINGLLFQYKPTCATSVGSTNTAQGTVVMATNYDVLDTTFANKQQMEAYEFCTSCVPFSGMVHPVECAPQVSTLKNLYIRTGAIATGSDQRFYDMGLFQIATVGMQAANVVGELWVSYSVRLLKPKIPTPVGSNFQYAHLVSIPLGSGAATTAYLGTSPGPSCVRAGSTYPVQVAGQSTFIMPNIGVFFIVLQANASTTGVPSLSGGSNLAAGANIFLGNANYYGSAVSSGTGILYGIWSVTAPGTGSANTFTISGCSGFAAGNLDIMICQIATNLTVNFSLLKELKKIQLRVAELEYEERKDVQSHERLTWETGIELSERRERGNSSSSSAAAAAGAPPCQSRTGMFPWS